jgi:hypothetical protein
MIITATAQQVISFKRTWPCSGLPDKAITFEFDSTGCLVDVTGPRGGEVACNENGAALAALADDAQNGTGVFSATVRYDSQAETWVVTWPNGTSECWTTEAEANMASTLAPGQAPHL